MGRRSLLTGAAASGAAGLGLWFTRASLDVFSSAGRPVRVAMLPSWPELVGLVMLAGLIAFLVRAAVVRVAAWRGAATGPGLADAADLLIPLVSLCWLAVPYAPWLADGVPPLRALAGPASVGVWLVVAGQVAWLAWEACARLRPTRDTRTGNGRTVLLVFLVGAVVFAAAAHRLSGGPLYPGGDEPHYLVITQSLLRDGDLRIDDNHARREYAAYYAGTLEPDAIVPGRDGATYSIHPVGLPILAVPAFAVAGYPGVVACLVLVAAWAAALMWRWAAWVTGSPAAATLAWIAVAFSAPFVLHSFAVYPEVIASACVITVVAWRGGEPDARPWTFAARSLVLGLVPWLGPKYAPMALVLVLALAWRARRDRRTLAAALAPWVVSIGGWLLFFQQLWGVPLPSAPYGEAHQMAPANLLIGGPALFVDQEYGVLPYAPALLLALPGLWHLWHDGGERREAAVQIALALAALVATVGMYYMWWGGSSPPGRQVVAGLLLLGLPLARWGVHAADVPASRAMGRVLALVGVVVTIALVLARDGLLVANRRDGGSELLEWLEPGRALVRVAPSAIAFRDDPLTFGGTVALWALAALAAGWIVGRAKPASGGRAAVMAASLTLAAACVAATAVPLTLGSRLAPTLEPRLRAQVPLLDGYDARRRPVSIVYDAWERVDAHSVPDLFAFDASPGARRQPQPLRVLLNMRLALPAGEYRLILTPRQGHALRGIAALQVGRIGSPLREWTIDAGAGQPWRQAFALPVDASFVGVRTTPEFEAHVASARVEPVRVVNASDRLDLPVVLSAGLYRGVIVTFHGEEVYPEQAGFWVRGRSTLLATFAVPVEETRSPGVRLSVHGGAVAARVRIATRTWSTVVDLEPGVSRHVEVPALSGRALLPVRFSTESGFVPAEHGGGSDRRLLGCWVEVMP